MDGVASAVGVATVAGVGVAPGWDAPGADAVSSDHLAHPDK